MADIQTRVWSRKSDVAVQAFGLNNILLGHEYHTIMGFSSR